MRRRFAHLTVFTLFVAVLAVPASAKQPAEVAALVDAALAAKLHAASQAQDALAAAPGHSATKIAERQARLAEKLARLAEKWADGKPGLGEGSDRSVEVHLLLASGCNPGKGEGQKLGHLRAGHKWAACSLTTAPTVYSGPPGHDPGKVKEPDD